MHEWSGDWAQIDAWVRDLYPSPNRSRARMPAMLDEMDDFDTTPDDGDGAEGEEDGEDEPEEPESYPSMILVKAGAGKTRADTGIRIECSSMEAEDAIIALHTEVDSFLSGVQDTTRIWLRLLPYTEGEKPGSHSLWRAKEILERQFSRTTRAPPPTPAAPPSNAQMRKAAAAPSTSMVPPRTPLADGLRIVPPREPQEREERATVWPQADLGDIASSLRTHAAENPVVALAILMVAGSRENENEERRERRELNNKVADQGERLIGLLDRMISGKNAELEAERKRAHETAQAERAAEAGRRDAEARAIQERQQERVRQLEERMTQVEAARVAAELRAQQEHLRAETERTEREQLALKSARRGSKPDAPESTMQSKLEDKAADGIGRVLEKALGDVLGDAKPEEKKPEEKKPETREEKPKQDLGGPLGMAAKMAGIDPDLLSPDNVAMFLRFMPDDQRVALLKTVAKSDKDFAATLINEAVDAFDAVHPKED